MLPTCGQGALCIETRTNDLEINQLIHPLNDPISSLCVQTERLVNAQLGGNCHVPLAVFCTISPANQLHLRARILSVDGSTLIEESLKGSPDMAASLASQCTEALLAKGAAALIQACSS